MQKQVLYSLTHPNGRDKVILEFPNDRGERTCKLVINEIEHCLCLYPHVPLSQRECELLGRQLLSIADLMNKEGA